MLYCFLNKRRGRLSVLELRAVSVARLGRVFGFVVRGIKRLSWLSFRTFAIFFGFFTTLYIFDRTQVARPAQASKEWFSRTGLCVEDGPFLLRRFGWTIEGLHFSVFLQIQFGMCPAAPRFRASVRR